MTDHLGQMLAELPVPDSARARERTVAAARAATPATARPRRRRSAIAAGIAVLIGLSLVTPPGQAAIEKVGELIGIGDVGDPPTMPMAGRDPDQGFIVANGYAPDGTGYEWTAYRAGDMFSVAGQDHPVDAFCVGFEWPGAPGRGGGACSTEPETSRSPYGPSYLSSYNIRWLQSRSEGVRRRDVMVEGVTTREPHDVRILYTDLQGGSHELPVEFTRVDGDLLERAGGERPFGVFTAFISDEQAHRDKLSSRFRDISLILPAPPASYEQPDWTPAACRSELEYGPFEYRFYDRAGTLLDRVRTIVGRRAPQACVAAMEKLEESGFIPPAP